MSVDVAVVGGGNGGHALAADLALRGYSVNQFEFPKFKKTFEHTLDKQCIEAYGLIEGTAELNKATLDIKEALNETEYILVSIPAYAHNVAFSTLQPFIKNKPVTFLPGNFSALCLHNTRYSRPRLSETNTLPYGCRVKENKVEVSVLANKVLLGSSPASEYIVFEGVKELFPNIIFSKNILEVALNNPNPLIHPTGALLNASRIDLQHKNQNIYEDGYTDSVRKVISAKDKERHAIGSVFKCEIINYNEFINTNTQGGLSGFIECGAMAGFPEPTSMTSRYISEDVPFGLVPWSELAKLADLKTPVINSEIILASIINNIDYFKNGRTLTEMGLDNLFDAKDLENTLNS